MSRKYRYLKDCEKELIEYIEQGHTLRETGEKFGFSYQEMRDFKTRYNKNQKETCGRNRNKVKRQTKERWE